VLRRKGTMETLLSINLFLVMVAVWLKGTKKTKYIKTMRAIFLIVGEERFL
jgi:hypothetical protein